MVKTEQKKIDDAIFQNFFFPKADANPSSFISNFDFNASVIISRQIWF